MNKEPKVSSIALATACIVAALAVSTAPAFAQPEQRGVNLRAEPASSQPIERITRLRAEPPSSQLIEQIARLSGGPDAAGVDRATQEAGIPAVLLNYHLATQVQLPGGPAMYIPRQVADREGGRQSLWTLAAGEETLAGIFVTGQGIALRYVKRETGRTREVADGDIFSERIMTQNGRERLVLLRGTFRALDPRIGHGSLHDIEVVEAAPGWQAYDDVRIWILWSIINVVYPDEETE